MLKRDGKTEEQKREREAIDTVTSKRVPICCTLEEYSKKMQYQGPTSERKKVKFEKRANEKTS